MSGYEILKYIHVVAVIAWVGGGIALMVLQIRLGAAGDRAGLLSVGRQMEGFGKFYYSPAAIITLLSGVWMVVTTESLAFEDAWIALGLIGVAASLVIGLGLITPTGRKLLAESERTPPNPEALAAHSARIKALGAANLGILLFVVWAMVAKPGL